MEIRWENLFILLAITLVLSIVVAYRQYRNGMSFFSTWIKAWFGFTAIGIVFLGFFG